MMSNDDIIKQACAEIAAENEKLAIHSAKRIIAGIAAQQGIIAEATDEIAKLQENLKKISVAEVPEVSE